MADEPADILKIEEQEQEILNLYDGKWIAYRDGEVIASHPYLIPLLSIVGDWKQSGKYLIMYADKKSGSLHYPL